MNDHLINHKQPGQSSLSPPQGEVREELQPPMSGHGDQDENGVDLSLLRENLKLTPTERWIKHQRALMLTLEVRRAGNSATAPEVP